MSRKKNGKQVRRSFSPEFKSDVVRLCQAGTETIKDVSIRLGLSESAVRNWVKQAEVDAGNSADPEALTTSEREELVRLRREMKRLTMEREILKKAAAFFAKESS